MGWITIHWFAAVQYVKVLICSFWQNQHLSPNELKMLLPEHSTNQVFHQLLAHLLSHFLFHHTATCVVSLLHTFILCLGLNGQEIIRKITEHTFNSLGWTQALVWKDYEIKPLIQQEASATIWTTKNACHCEKAIPEFVNKFVSVYSEKNLSFLNRWYIGWFQKKKKSNCLHSVLLFYLKAYEKISRSHTMSMLLLPLCLSLQLPNEWWNGKYLT